MYYLLNNLSVTASNSCIYFHVLPCLLLASETHNKYFVRDVNLRIQKKKKCCTVNIDYK